MDSNAPWPAYDLDLLTTVARAQLTAAGEEPSALSIYRRVIRLRREQLTAFVAGQPWPPPLPKEPAHVSQA